MTDVSPPAGSLRPECIPIALGFVGHRALPAKDSADYRAIVAGLDAIFAQVDRAFPHSPRVLLSPLAAGADQLAADLALARGWRVRAPLPFEPAVFKASTSFRFGDRRDTAAEQHLDAQLAHPAVEWFVAPLPHDFALADRRVIRRADQWFFVTPSGGEEAVDWAAVAGPPEGQPAHVVALQNACYANPGGYIVRHCHALVALWDGDEAASPSGTPEIVRFKLGGLAPEFYPWTTRFPLGFDGDRGPVFVVHCPRASERSRAVPAGTRSVRLPVRDRVYGAASTVDLEIRPLGKWTRFKGRVREALGRHRHADESPEFTQFLDVCQAIDDFNKDVAAIRDGDVSYGSTYADRRARTVVRLYEVFRKDDPPAPSHQMPAIRDQWHRLAGVFDAADHLCGHSLDWWWKWSLRILLGVLFAALLVFHIHSHPFKSLGGDDGHTQPWYLLLAFVALWPAMLAGVLWTWHSRRDTRRLDYRALAEALRIRLAWAEGGVGRSVSDSYLPQLRTELAWVRRALQHLSPPAGAWREAFDALPPDRRRRRLADVLAGWVTEQAGQYQRSRDKEHRAAHTCRRLGLGLAVAGWLLYVVVLVVSAAAAVRSFDAGPFSVGHPWAGITLAAGMSFVGGGLLVAYSDRRNFEPLARQYDNIHTVFAAGASELTYLLNPRLLADLRRSPVDGPPPSASVGAPDEPIDFDRARRVLEELGCEALQETGQWVLLHRSKPLELALN